MIDYFKSSFLGKDILLSDKCNTYFGAVRDGKIYEQQLIYDLYHRLDTNKSKINLIDVGSNTGAFMFLSLFNPNINCFAIEPNPIIFSILNENIELNNLKDNVKSFNLGIWENERELMLRVPTDKIDSGLATFGDGNRFKYNNKNGDFEEYIVNCNTIDNLVVNWELDSVDVIKIDTEGAELAVLNGAIRTIQKYHPLILMEYDSKNTLQFGYEREALYQTLQSLGYNKFELISPSDLLATYK